MRKGVFGVALAVLVAAAALAMRPAQAMPLSAPAGLNDAIKAVDITETVSCQSVWRCGYYGCGWRRICWAPRVSYYRPHYRPYHHHYQHRPHYTYHRPYYRPYYRTYHRHYHSRWAYRPYRPYVGYSPYVRYRDGYYDTRNVGW